MESKPDLEPKMANQGVQAWAGTVKSDKIQIGRPNADMQSSGFAALGVNAGDFVGQHKQGSGIRTF